MPILLQRNRFHREEESARKCRIEICLGRGEFSLWFTASHIKLMEHYSNLQVNHTGYSRFALP